MFPLIKYITLLSSIILSKSEIEYSSCIDGKRTVFFEDGTNKTFDCIECLSESDLYTTYDNVNDNLQCQSCPNYAYSFGADIVIDTFNKKLLKRHLILFDVNCDNDNKKLCPNWQNYVFSLKVENVKENIDSKSSLKWNQYYVNDGKFIIKYINYNGDINKYIHIYINKILVYKDDTRHSKVKTKEFEIKKGQNEFEVIYIVDKNLSKKNNSDIESYFEILEIKMTNAETSALECQKFDQIDYLKSSLLSNCDYYIDKCSSEDICTYRFYSEKSNGSDINKGIQIISYNKIEGGICKELTAPTDKEIEAEECTYGQLRKFIENSENIYTCEECPENTYNDELINYEFECKENCDTDNKEFKKILYINDFDDQSEYKGLSLNITENIAYVEINYEKFNLKEDTIIYLGIMDNEKSENYTHELINPNILTNISTEKFLFKIPFSKGSYNVEIKGKNMKLKTIKVINTEEGGNCLCIDKLNPEEEIICEETEYYSPNKKICDECPYGSFINDNSQCLFTQQIISNKFIMDNSLLLQNEIFSKEKTIQGEDNTQYNLYLNPSFPLIYSKKSDNTSQIIGNELDKIKLIRGINERGIILSYIHNDNDLNYTTYIYLKCNKSEEKLEIIKEEENDSNKYFYFIFESDIICPYCLDSEVEKIKTDGQCIDNKELFNITIKDISECVIKPYNDSTSSKVILKENDAMLLFYNSSLLEDQNLINTYKINEQIPIFNETEEDEIVTETQRYEDCGTEPEENEDNENEGEEEKETTEENGQKGKDDDDDNSLGAGYIVLIVIASLVVALALTFIILRYIKRKKNDNIANTIPMQELTLKSAKEEE